MQKFLFCFVFNRLKHASYKGIDGFRLAYRLLNPAGGELLHKEMEAMLPAFLDFTRLSDDDAEQAFNDRIQFRRLCTCSLQGVYEKIIQEVGTGRRYEHVIATATPHCIDRVRLRTIETFDLDEVYAPGFEQIPFALPPEVGLRSWKRLRRIARRLSFFAFFDMSLHAYVWFWQVFERALRYTVLSNCLGTLYFFDVYTPAFHLLAEYCSYYLPEHEIVYFVEEQMPYHYLRYSQIKGTLVVSSDIQKEQAELLHQRGWLLANKFMTYGPDIPTHPQDPKRTEAVYDIGFISSGEWARRFGRQQVRAEEYELVRAGEFLDNQLARTATSVLDVVLKYAQAHDLSVCIYPHPYERLLLKQDIRPPWFAFVDNESVYMDRHESSNSEETVKEAFVSVSSQSTLTLKRLEQGYRNSFQGGYGFPNTDADFMDTLGKYCSYYFATLDELCDKLEGVFYADAPRSSSLI